MSKVYVLPVAIIGLLSMGPLQTIGHAEGQDKPAVQAKLPQPGVPEVMQLEAKFVRVAYNAEGYVILGYQATNYSVGEEWMLLETGVTVLGKTPPYKIRREHFSLETPDGKTLPMPTVLEQRGGPVKGIQNRARVQRDSINYFPVQASKSCGLLFFPDLDARALPYDETELTNDRACVGRLYFKIPGGITYGQYWLNVKFENSLIRVPFRVMTKDEEKFLSKNYKSIDKQVKEAFRPKKK